MPNYQNLSKEALLKLVEEQAQELKSKRYGLVWDSEKEPEQVVLDCENNLPILQRVKEKEIKTDTSDDNILIEGDNYHALTCLNYTHKEKIDVIYIDPPYNTGKANEWKYNDKYVDENDGYRHSKWLNLMEKRLKLASNLMSEKGVIFISIDDNEMAQLKMLCDKIFGENQFVSSFIWHNNVKGRQMDRFIKNTYENILLYCANKDKLILNLEQDSVSTENLEYDGVSFYKKDYPLHNGTADFHINNRPNLAYSIYYNPLTKDALAIDEKIKIYSEYKIGESLRKDLLGNGYLRIIPKFNAKYNNQRVWRWGAIKFLKEYQTELIFCEEDSYFYQKKRFDDQGLFEKKFKNYINIDTGVGKQELLSVLGSKKFENPKSSFLMIEILKIASNKNSIILDFFAGSGTTGHAVLQLNQQDGGNRKFILCTNNENQICEDVTYPRIHNVIKGYKFEGKDKTKLFEQKLTFSQLKNIDSIVEEMGKIVEENKSKFDEIEKKFEDSTIKITGINNIDGFKDGLGGNLQYFKTDLIPVGRIDNIDDHQRQQLTHKAGQMIAIKESTFEEVEINEWYQIFENKAKNRKTAIYFRENMDDLSGLITKLGKTKTVLYIFSYGRIDKKLFKYVGKNITIEDIPEPILEIYKVIQF